MKRMKNLWEFKMTGWPKNSRDSSKYYNLTWYIILILRAQSITCTISVNTCSWQLSSKISLFGLLSVNTRGWDLVVLFQELKQVVLHEGFNKVPLIKWHCMTILWNLVYTYLVKAYLLIIINAWELKISLCGNLTTKFKCTLKCLQKGGPLIHELNL